MNNSTKFSTFILAGYTDVGQLKYLYFILMTMLYISILFANTLLIVVICTERSLHKPMYLLLCSLFVNDLYGITALFPALMINLLSDDHSVYNVCCYIQIFCMYTYGCIEFSNLAVMSYDRYLAICYPLQYNVLMTPRKVCILVCLIWLLIFAYLIIDLSLTLRLELCGNVLNKVICDNYVIVKLACSKSEATVNNIIGLFGLSLLGAVPFFLICFSYFKIFTICLKSPAETRKKAFSTCTPHLVSLLNFSFGSFLNIIQSRFDRPMKNLPTVLQAVLSVYYLICQPLLNPILYGVRISKIRQTCKNILPAGMYPKT